MEIKSFTLFKSLRKTFMCILALHRLKIKTVYRFGIHTLYYINHTLNQVQNKNEESKTVL